MAEEQKKEFDEKQSRIARGGKTDKYGNKYSDMTGGQKK